MIDRDYAREVWKTSGYDYTVLTYPNLYQLTKRLEHYLDLHTELQMWIHRDRKGVPFNEFPIYQPPFEWVEITVDASYFENREAITFNRGVFVSPDARSVDAKMTLDARKIIGSVVMAK